MTGRVPLRIGACAYLLSTFVSLRNDGWHSLYWLGWLLMAVGFFAFSRIPANLQGGRLNWRRSPAILIGCGTLGLGLGFIIYHVLTLSR